MQRSWLLPGALLCSAQLAHVQIDALERLTYHWRYQAQIANRKARVEALTGTVLLC
jgi:hypothetical protein